MTKLSQLMAAAFLTAAVMCGGTVMAQNNDTELYQILKHKFHRYWNNL